MASEVPNTGVNSGQSLAAMLEEQHARDNAHRATVEDAVDEEDIRHPLPSSFVNDPKPAAQAAPSAAPATPTPAQAAPKKAPVFDVRSEESFPALGSGPKPKTPTAATWGAKPSAAAAVANGAPSGAQGTLFLAVILLG